MPNLTCGESRLRTLQLDDATSVYVIENDALERLLFDRSLVGLQFTEVVRAATRSFLQHLQPEIEAAGEDIAELTVLTKGLYYEMRRAFAEVFGRNLEGNFIATKRVSVEGRSVTVEVPYSDFSAPATNLIIADTIASGATLSTVLEHYLEFGTLRRVFAFSAAGSVSGARVLTALCRQRGVELTLAYGLAAFGLAENGFDLAFLHPDTRCLTPEYLDRATSVFGGKPVSAVGWDFGSQAQSVRKYRMLCWLEAEHWGMQDNPLFALKQPLTEPRLVEKEKAAYRQL